MSIHRFLAVVAAAVLSAVPVSALADDLVYDDGSFEAAAPLSVTVAPAVQFTAPGAGVYALDAVSFSLRADAPGTYPVAVQIWDEVLEVAETIAWDVDVTGDAVYTLDVTAAKLPFTGSTRVGIFLRDDGIVPVPTPPLSLGVDTTAPAGVSFVYDSAAAPPTWTADDAVNYGIRATVHAVPALTCEGFLPPFNRPRTMKRGGRTIPLKVRLFDDTAAPVTAGLLSAPPLVELLYTPEEGAEPIDVTAFVAPAGRSDRGQAFRPAGEGKWIFNLKTKKFLPPGTYTVLMGSGDGTGYVVEPTCTGTFVIESPRQKKPHPGRGPQI